MNKENIIRVAREFGWSQKDIDSLLCIVEMVAEAEREECAKLCDEQATDYEESDPWNGCAQYLANYIRARGEI